MAQPDPRSYVLISPCRNEAEYMRKTLDSVVAQTDRPTKWIVVDDGSTDETPQILADYAAKHDWIQIATKPDRGFRAVGPGVIEAFYHGLEQIEMGDYAYLCKLDLDLDLPAGYFGGLMDRMEANPRIGTCSGKPYFKGANGQMISEKCGDEMSVGMTKFFRRDCFEQIGGFVREVMWDAIDCHRARQLGWIAVSWDIPALRFEHLRAHGVEPKKHLYRAPPPWLRPVFHGVRSALFRGDGGLPYGASALCARRAGDAPGLSRGLAEGRAAIRGCRAACLHPRLSAPGAARRQGPCRLEIEAERDGLLALQAAE